MNILTQNNTQSMNSFQIAELLRKRHDKVKQSIERLAAETEAKPAVIALPPTGVVLTEFNNRKYKTEVYVFSGEQGKRDSIIVVAQLSPEFTAKLVDRWAELEKQAKQPKIPQTYAEALQLAADQALKIEQDAPKVAHYDKVVQRDNLLTATQVGQKVKMSAIKLNRVLSELGVYNGSLKRGKAFKQWFVADGLGEMKQTDEGYSQPLFTTKGEAWVIERLASEGVA